METTTTERINLEDLRANYGSGIKPAEIRALIDAVEAARAQVYPGGHLDPSWLGSDLKRTIDRFA